MQAVQTAFMQHISDHGLSYGTVQEYNFRLDLFKATHDIIESHNNSLNQTYRLGHNFLSTWTDAEKKRLNGYIASPAEKAKEFVPVKDLPETVNWVTAGAVNPVQNQASCGSCWAFSTVGAVEGAHFIASKELVKLSEEQLVDCSKKNHGCNGGSMVQAMYYLKTYAADTEASYPYTSGAGKVGKCNTSVKPTAVKVTKVTQVNSRSPEALKAAIATGPVSVAIEADKAAFQQYQSGVLTGDACGKNLDHGVLAVGYGTENGTPYYLVKNSWGPTWGDKGYIKIGINAGSGPGVCGIQVGPVQPKAN